MCVCVCIMYYISTCIDIHTHTCTFPNSMLSTYDFHVHVYLPSIGYLYRIYLVLGKHNLPLILVHCYPFSQQE